MPMLMQGPVKKNNHLLLKRAQIYLLLSQFVGPTKQPLMDQKNQLFFHKYIHTNQKSKFLFIFISFLVGVSKVSYYICNANDHNERKQTLLPILSPIHLYSQHTANILIVRTTIFYRVSFIIVISSYSLQWMAGYSQWQQLFLITAIHSSYYYEQIRVSTILKKLF